MLTTLRRAVWPRANPTIGEGFSSVWSKACTDFACALKKNTSAIPSAVRVVQRIEIFLLYMIISLFEDDATGQQSPPGTQRHMLQIFHSRFYVCHVRHRL